MNCIKCGNEIEENAKFCTSCGALQEQSTQPVNPTSQQAVPYTVAASPTPVIPAPQKAKPDAAFIIKAIMNALGAFSGILSILFGIIVASLNTGFYVSTESYGGDAYTGIQNAAAYTGKNVLQTNRILEAGLCFILIVIGLALISYFVPKLFEIISANKSAKK